MIQDNLMNRSKEELIMLIHQLMNKLTEKQRLEFILKWISPQDALEEAGIGDSGSFCKKVESFCKDCLDRKYFIEPDYDCYDYYNDEETVDYSESKWAEQFSTFLKLSLMYSRNKNYDTSYMVFDRLLACLHEAELDEEILGTENPMDYIEVDWNEVFEEYYISMKNHIFDKPEVEIKAIEIWLSHQEICTEIILKNFSDVEYIEQAIRKSIAENLECWFVQHQLYELLKSFYLKVSLEFNEITILKSLVCYNPNFRNDLAQGYINSRMWEEAILNIKKALKEVTDRRVVSDLYKKVVDCFENLNMFSEAYDVAVKMFIDHNSHELYLRARSLALKISDLNAFVDNMEKYIRLNNGYDSISTLLRIFSFEGYTSKLIDTALKSDGYYRHDYLKFTSKSLIYRALGSKNVLLPDLQEYIQSIENGNISGIVDMIKTSKDSDYEKFLLNSAIGILKQMIQFHIDVAKRSRYARAAYYCAIIKDIYIYKNEMDEFNKYYMKILMENNRRLALKDEMKLKIYQ